MLQKRDYAGEEDPKITVYSFGQPRVGNKPFASAFGNALTGSSDVSLLIYQQSKRLFMPISEYLDMCILELGFVVQSPRDTMT